MKKLRSLTLIFISLFILNACNEQESIPITDHVPDDVLAALDNAGFDIYNQVPINFESGYLVEGDIYIKSHEIDQLRKGARLPFEEQYSTNNLVSTGGSRNITIYIPQEGSGSTKGKKGGGGGGYSSTYVAALDEAIARYNSENLEILFTRITNPTADIVFTRLSKGDERRGVLGSAGFPTSSGDPYGEIKMSGVLESKYGLGVSGIATIMAHELGHCIGFRHTDYFDRSISCGGAPTNEGDGGIGANHIPGTPTGAIYSDLSWMLSCTDGGNRPFNNADKTALDYLY